MKKLLFALVLFATLKCLAQPITQDFFSQNAWSTVYNNSFNPTPSNTVLPTNDPNDAFVQNIGAVTAMGAHLVRIGGANANILGNFVAGAPTYSPLTKQQALYLVIKIRQNGMEPIVQVPYLNPGNTNTTLAQAASDAKDMVDYINNQFVNIIPEGKVKYWIIANEPDKDKEPFTNYKIGYNYNETDPNSPGNIAAYIKRFAIEMRNADPSIKIIGPELAFPWEHMFLGNSTNFNNLGLLQAGQVNDISGLISAADVPTTVATPSVVIGKPFIDYVSFHYYGTSTSTTTVIQNIHNPAQGKIKAIMAAVQATCNSALMGANRTFSGTVYPLQMAITEANLQSSTVTPTDADSFIRGQWWADFASICIPGGAQWVNYWSSAETNNFGAMTSTGVKRSTYHHYKMMADNFKGIFTPTTSINIVGSGTPSDIKAFAAKSSDQVAVMILNQRNAGGNVPFRVLLNGSGASTTPNDLNISFGIGGLPGTPGYTSAATGTTTIQDESTVLLIFNCVGQLVERWDYKKNSTAPVKTQTSTVTLLGNQISSNPSFPIPITANSTLQVTFSPVTYTYSWANACNGVVPTTSQNGSTITFTACNSPSIAVYTFTVTDNLGCTSTQNVNISQGVIVGSTGNALQASLGPVGPSSCAAASGSAIVSASQGNYPYAFSWDNGPFSALSYTAPSFSTISGLAVGPHQVTVRDSYSITSTLYFSVPMVAGTQSTLNAGTSYSLCPGETIQMNAIANANAISYTWSPATGLSDTHVLNPFLTAINSGSTIISQVYTLTTTGNVCPGSGTVQMTFFPKPTITANTTSATICVGSVVTLTSSAFGPGPFSYAWSPLVTGWNTPTITGSPSVTTVYTEKVTGANSCVNFKTYTVNVNYQNSNFSYLSANICANSLATIQPIIAPLSGTGNFISTPVLNQSQLNPLTGVLTPGAIPVGTYIITNSVSTCGGSASPFTLNISKGGVIANAGPDIGTYRQCRTILNGSSSPPLSPTAYNWYKQGSATPLPPGNSPTSVVYSTGNYILEANAGTCKSYDDMNVYLLSNNVACKRSWPILYTERTMCSGGKNYSGVITSDLTLANDTVWITNDLTIVNSKTLTFSNVLVIVYPNVQIKVQPGGKLNIDGSSFQTCDGSKWNGINVIGDHQTAGQLIVSSSYFTDAPNVITTDKAVNLSVSGSLFYGGNIAMNLDRNKGFSITQNEFAGYNIGIKTTRTEKGSSIIAENTFVAVKTAISFDGDDHSKLILSCNNFDSYQNYAVDSRSTILQDQGTLASGAGNKFAGSSTPTDKIRHSGNSMQYYYDPSSPVMATSNVITQAALYDRSCVIVTAREMGNQPVIKTATASEDARTTSVMKEIEVKAFPNPFTDNLTVTYSLPASSKSGELKIYEAASGKLVYFSSLNTANNKVDIQLGVAQGLYICHIIADDGTSKQFKLVHIK